MKLYEIADDYRTLIAWMEDHAEELAQVSDDGSGPHPELLSQLDQIHDDFARKAEAVALIIRELIAESAAWKAEADRLAAHARATAARADWLKGYLLHQLRRMDLRRVDGRLIKIRRQVNTRPAIAPAGDPADLPSDWKKVTIALDGTRAYEDLKAAGKLPTAPGEYPIDGLRVTLGEHVRIV